MKKLLFLLLLSIVSCSRGYDGFVANDSKGIELLNKYGGVTFTLDNHQYTVSEVMVEPRENFYYFIATNGAEEIYLKEQVLINMLNNKE